MCTSGEQALRARQRRFFVAALLFAILGAQLGSTSAAGAQNIPPSDDEACARLARTEGVIEGEVVAREVLVDEFSTNIDLISVRTESGITQRIEVDGDPGLVELGTTYSFTTITLETEEGETVLISSAFGEHLQCLMEEREVEVDDTDVIDGEGEGEDENDAAEVVEGDGEPAEVEVELIPVENGVALLASDGTTTPIEKPPFLPTLPVATRTFFIGFGIFAAVIFLIRFR